MSSPKKHHYLPQFYLRYFKVFPQQTKNPRIWVFQKTAEITPFVTPIKDTACIADYHTVEESTGIKDRLTFEAALSRIEHEQAELTHRIVQTKAIDQKDKTGIVTFVALMRTRVPSFKAYIQETQKMAVLSAADLAYERGRLPPPPKELEQYLKGKAFSDVMDVDISNWALLRYMYDVAMQSRIAQLLYKMKATVVEASKPHFFITCDSPVSLFHPEHIANDRYGKGLLDKAIELFLPLSTNIGILFRWNDSPDYLEATSAEVEEFNRRTIITASKYIYAHKAEDWIEKQIKKNRRLAAGFKMERVATGDGFCIISKYIPVTKDTN
jgi:hypothetical protein